MSIHMRGMVEFKYPGMGSDSWWAAARVFFYGDVHAMAVLGHPWEPWEEGGDLPAPVVPMGKDFPPNLSIMTRAETHRVVGKRTKNEDDSTRFCTPAQAKRWKESQQIPGYFLDPDEWRGCAVFTTAQLHEAAERYKKYGSSGRYSPEINGALMMMKAIEGNAPPGTETRLIVWFQ